MRDRLTTLARAPGAEPGNTDFGSAALSAKQRMARGTKEADKFGLPMNAGLGEDGLEVASDRIGRNLLLARDELHRMTFGDQAGDARFRRCQIEE